MKTKLKEQTQQQETIPQELVQKFDGDKQLVQEFMEQGYSADELLKSDIIHPTKFDPVCLVNGESIGIWLYFDNNHMTNKNVKYTDSRF